MPVAAHPSAENRRIVSCFSGSKRATNTPPAVRDFISVADLPSAFSNWIADNKAAGHSQFRIENTSGVTQRLLYAVAFFEAHFARVVREAAPDKAVQRSQKMLDGAHKRYLSVVKTLA